MAAAAKMPAVFGEAQPEGDHEEQPHRAARSSSTPTPTPSASSGSSPPTSTPSPGTTPSPSPTSTTSDVMADFSVALYATYKTRQEQAAAEQEQIKQLVESLSSERERNEVMQKQLEGLSFLDKRKATKPKLVTDQVPSVSAVPPDADQVIVHVQSQGTVVSPIKPPPGKCTKPVAPVPRRARARGALLQDTEENDDDE